MIRDGVTYYYIFNAHGDTVALVDVTGTVRATYSYDPWGQVTVTSGSTIKNPFLYAGQFGIYHDVATGLDLMQTRYYNSGIQRFMSADEFLGYVDYPLSQNAYIYVHDDPTNKVDPDGHDGFWDSLKNEWNEFKEDPIGYLGDKIEDGIEWVDENIVTPVKDWVNNDIAPLVDEYIVNPIKESEIGQGIIRFIEDPIGTITDALTSLQEEAKRLAEETKRKAEEELAKAKAVFENTTQEISKAIQASIEAIRSIDVNNELDLVNQRGFAKEPIGSFETLAKVFGFGFMVKSKWDQFAQSQEERRLQSLVPLAELELKMRGIDPSNPDYNERLIETVRQTDATMSIGMGAYGGVRFGRAPSKILRAKVSGNFLKVNNGTIINSATAAKKGGETVVGHALQKHAGRNPDIWGMVKGGPDQINRTALNHLEDIINAPGGFSKVTNQNGIQFLEKKLPDGRGVRLNLDGTFKGFIDQ